MAQSGDSLSGQSLAHYHVVDKIGQGGMGEVYRAQDSKLGRSVALKLLPAAFAQDAERLARFRREARTLASLQHPHVATIFGLEETAQHRFLVMELVEGEDLAQRIAHGAVPVEETLAIARQMAEGIEAAHEKGIVHRDLKPANVKLATDGTVKVLDFGLARAYADDPAEGASPMSSPTLTAQMTTPGVLLGTAAYMSPEQARGRAVDKRADIWAFGVIVFELLTGRQLFEGETVSDTLASVLRSEVEWDRLPAGLSPAIHRLLRRCLERNPRQRLRDIGEARILLEDVIAGKEPAASATASAIPAPAPARARMPMVVALLIGAALGALAVGVATWRRHPAPVEPRVRKLELLGSESAGTPPESPVISPDGRHIAFLSGNRLWVRELDQLEPRELRGTEGAGSPFWSPDGASLGYLTVSKVMKVALSGGDPVPVCDAGAPTSGGRGGTWTEDGRILYSRGDEGGILEVPARGGDPKAVILPDTTSEQDLHEPTALPGNRGILYMAHIKGGTANTVKLFAGGKSKVLFVGGKQRIWNPVFSPTDHVLFRRDDGNPGIWALPFSLARLEATGPPFLALPNGFAPSVSVDGTLACTRRATGGNLQLQREDHDGRAVTAIGQPQRLGHWLDLSHDGTRLAVEINDGESSNIWTVDLMRGTQTRLTFDTNLHQRPAWSPTGDRIAYVVGREVSAFTIAMQASDGTDQPRTVTKGWGPEFTPDGRILVYATLNPESSWDIAMVGLEPGAQPAALIKDAGWQYDARVSPDGNYITYVSQESGQDEIFLKRFPHGEGKWQVSATGGCWPRWNARGDQLIYISGDDLMEVTVETGATVRLGQPHKLFTRASLGLDTPNGWPGHFAVSPDGQTLFLIHNVDRRAGRAAVTIVENWYGEFRGGK